ncbi:hypothetical protein KEJ26_04630 [Candidatus Bathyarchaeota archaeon]|nr:hypothetical protein [Candidatus Bathyarchaeota archaeon]
MKLKKIGEKVSPNKYAFEILCDVEFFNEYLKPRGFSYDSVYERALFETRSHQTFLRMREFLKYLSVKTFPGKVRKPIEVFYKFQPTTITWTPIHRDNKSSSHRKTRLKDVLTMEAAEPKGSRRESE